MSDFRSTAPLANLQWRAKLLQRIRAFFDERGFFEVTTPVLSRDTVVDRHIDPLSVTVYTDPKLPDVGPKWFLQTSPEFHMKRLVASGANAIYQMSPVFRAAEVGTQHNIEFTMLEWYRVEDDMRAGMNLLAEFIESVGKSEPAEFVSYRAVFQRHLGIDPFSATTRELRELASVDTSFDRDDCLEWLFGERISPLLGKERPAIVYDFPANQAALAKIRTGDVNYAERFELFLGGLELANGYHELCSASELRERIRACNRLRLQDGKRALPDGSRLLEAMEAGLPKCSGVAVGVDRLAMALLPAESLREVTPFGFENA